MGFNPLGFVAEGAKKVAGAIGDFFSGDDGRATVTTNFTTDINTTIGVIQEAITNVELEITEDTNVSNSLTVGKLVINGNKNKYTLDSNQTAKATVAKVYNDIIKQIMSQSNNTASRLDALATITQQIKDIGSDLWQKGATGEANVHLKNSTDVNLSNIQRLNQSLKYASMVCASNDIFVDDVTINGNENEVNYILNQNAELISESLIKMITDTNSDLKSDVKEDYKLQIEENNEAETQGIFASLGKSLAEATKNIFDGFGKYIVIGGFVIVGIIIIIMVLFTFIIILRIVFRKRDKTGGYMNFSNFDY